MCINIGGMTPLTSHDFPGKWAAVLFLQGCPWRCRYCHNPHLWENKPSTLTWESVYEFLTKRVGLLDGVVFSGGEPTLQPNLLQAIQSVKDLGFAIGLHTGGAFPKRLEAILPLIDWVGFDFKAPLDCYEPITQKKPPKDSIHKSLKLLLDSGTPYEFRTTIHPTLHTESDLLTMATQLKELGAKRYILQQFRPTGCQDSSLNNINVAHFPSSECLEKLEQSFDHFEFRKAQ